MIGWERNARVSGLNTMRGIANPLLVLPVLGVIYIYVMIQLGGVWLPNGWVIAKATRPRAYWSLIALCAGAVVALIGLWIAFRQGH